VSAPPGPLALGLALGAPTNGRYDRLLELGTRADALGLHSVWLPEGHFTAGGTSAPLTLLAALAPRTRRVRLATTSILLPIHHPLRLAADVVTLDALSGGRVLLGLGRGFRPALFQAFGVDVKTKRDRFDEALDAMLAAWSGASVRLDGDHFAAHGDGAVRLSLRPVQRPHPPLVVAAFGPKALAQAARRGLPYLASPLETLPLLEENYARWRELAGAARLGDAPRVPVMRTAFLARDTAQATQVRVALEAESGAMRRSAPKALARAAEGRLEDRVLVGTRSELEDGIARYRERLGMDLLVVRTEVPGVDEAERTAGLERLAELVAESFA